MDDSTLGERLQDHSNAPLLCPDHLTTQNYTFCHWAKTVSGWDVNAEKYVVVAVTCKRWGCPYCAIRKIRRLAWMSRNAEPNRLLTLTLTGPDNNGRPGRYADGKTAWEESSKAFPELIRFIRKNVSECEYLRVLELQANGMPHFHCMLRSGFIKHSIAHAEWKRLIGKPDHWPSDQPMCKQWAGLNIKRIDDTFATFRYLVKYLTKLHQIEWTDRHVSYSKGFFRDEDKEEVEYAKLDELTKYDQHPWVWLNERYGWDNVRVIGEGRWLIDGQIMEPGTTIDPKQLGLPSDTKDEPTTPLKQRLIPGTEETRRDEEDANLDATGRKKRSAKRYPPPGTARESQMGSGPAAAAVPF
jgi:hypothetical protein